MNVTKKSLSRRTFLQGVGAVIGLPLLDSMVPALAGANHAATKPAQRLGVVYVPHGDVDVSW